MLGREYKGEAAAFWLDRGAVAEVVEIT